MVKSLFSLLSVTFVVLWFMGCQSSPSLSSIQVTPDSATLTYKGQTMQFKAIGTYIHTTHSSFTQDITNQVSWASSSASISTIIDDKLFRFVQRLESVTQQSVQRCARKQAALWWEVRP
jgi:hypothetical protein